MKNFKKISLTLLFLLTLSFLISCQPEDNPQDNGDTAVSVDASFSITPVANATNKYLLTAATKDVLGSRWDLGDGGGTYTGRMTETIFLPDAGTYNIVHTAIGRGGATSTSTKTLIVTTPDPISGNLVRGGKFANAADHAQWTRLKIGTGTTTNWVFNSGSASIFGGSWNQEGLYQIINVVAGRKYKIDLVVSGGGSQNTWFEVYANATAPVQGVDYTAGGRRMGLSTWDGCANTSFSGKLSEVGCVGSGGEITFTQSGPIYFLIKSGGENIGASGITMTNVQLRGL